MKSSPLRIACVDNVSAVAYRLEDVEGAVVFLSPSEICREVLSGRCDAALLPTGCLRDASRYAPFGDYGIACTGEVYSVCVFSDRCLEPVLRGGGPIWVTRKSRTSRQLLSLLCLEEFGRLPVYTETWEAAPTRLLIGDEAVAQRAHPPKGCHATDLGAWWHRQTGYPFVFARWVVRRSLDVESRDILSRWLEACSDTASRADGVSRLEDHAARLIGGDRLPADYYHRLRIRLSDADLAGLSLFQHRMEALAACPLSA